MPTGSIDDICRMGAGDVSLISKVKEESVPKRRIMSPALTHGTTIDCSNHFMEIHTQIIWLFVLAIPIACLSWTVTHEEVFREPREYCVEKSRNGRTFALRKFFYLFTCEYCFSHYITILMLIITRYTLLMSGWRGYILAGLALVWVANIYMSLYAFIRIDIKKERIKAKQEEEKLNGS